MRRYSKVYNDPIKIKKIAGLSHRAVLVYCLLERYPEGNILGIFPLSKDHIYDMVKNTFSGEAEVAEYLMRGYFKTLSELSERGLIKYDICTREVMICGYLKENPFNSPNQAKSANRVAGEIRSKLLLEALKEEVLSCMDYQTYIIDPDEKLSLQMLGALKNFVLTVIPVRIKGLEFLGESSTLMDYKPKERNKDGVETAFERHKDAVQTPKKEHEQEPIISKSSCNERNVTENSFEKNTASGRHPDGVETEELRRSDPRTMNKNKNKNKNNEQEKENTMSDSGKPESDLDFSCPHEKLVELWNNTPGTTKFDFSTLTRGMKATITKRWKQYPSLDSWQKAFSTVMKLKSNNWNPFFWWIFDKAINTEKAMMDLWGLNKSSTESIVEDLVRRIENDEKTTENNGSKCNSQLSKKS